MEAWIVFFLIYPCLCQPGYIQASPIECQSLFRPEQETWPKWKIQACFRTQFLGQGLHLSLVRGTAGIPANQPVIDTDLDEIVDLRDKSIFKWGFPSGGITDQ